MAANNIPVEITLLVSAWDNVKKNLIREFCVVEDEDMCLDHMNLPTDAFGDLIADLDNSIDALAAEYDTENQDDIYDGADLFVDADSAIA